MKPINKDQMRETFEKAWHPYYSKKSPFEVAFEWFNFGRNEAREFYEEKLTEANEEIKKLTVKSWKQERLEQRFAELYTDIEMLKEKIK